MTTKAPPIEQTNEIGEVKAEVDALRERLAAVESLLVGLYGANALGSASPSLPPAEPPPAPLRIKPIASIGRFVVG